MRKEVFIAIFLGLSLGLIVTYGIYTARKAFISTIRPTGEEETLDGSPQPQASATNPLVLLSPEDETIQTTKDLKIIGTTKPNATVVAFINNTSLVSKADNSGNFSLSGTLESGGNLVTVKTIDSDGNIAEDQHQVVYMTLDVESPLATASATASSSAKPKVTPKPSPKTSSTPKPSSKP